MGEEAKTYQVAQNYRLYETYDKNVTQRLEGRLGSLPLNPGQEFSGNAISVLRKRYLAKDEDGRVLEDTRGLMTRVAANIAYPDFHYASLNTGTRATEVSPQPNAPASGQLSPEEIAYQSALEFYNMMMNREFMPNSPTLMNAGRVMQQLSACFVIPLADKMKFSPKKDPSEDLYKGAILDGIRDTGDIHQTGGGTGFSFGNLRRKNDFVSTTYGKASGPVSFIGAYDAMTHSVNQGGFRRGANMGNLPNKHPDILEFIHAKENEAEGRYTNFNFSVAVFDDFIKAVKNGEHYVLRNPRKGKLYDLTVKDLERDARSVSEGLIKQNDRVLIVDDKGHVIYQNPTRTSPNGDVEEVEQKKVGRVDEQGRITLDARIVFDEIVQLAHKNGEPGVIFIDRMNETNPTHPRYFKGNPEK